VTAGSSTRQDDTVPAVLTRLAARLLTGPVGHLLAGLVDWAAVLGKVLWARVRRRPVRW